MCEVCRQKAQNIAKLAQYFRDKVGETQSTHFIELMKKTAGELDDLAKHYTDGCRCTDDCASAVVRSAQGRG